MGICKTSRQCNQPETHGQAASARWREGKYLEQGLCPACAVQAALGHQMGFTAHEHVRGNHVVLEGVNPPCDSCAPIVAGFPVPAGGGWRKHPSAIREFAVPGDK